MPDEIRKLRVLGAEIDVVDVQFTPLEEHFNKYELSDGSVISVKAVATAVLRVHNQFTPDGDPIYLVYTSPANRVVSSLLKPSPEHLVQ